MAGPEPKLRELFSKALERQTAEEQAAFLDQVCQGDAELRAQLEDLLQAHREAGSFLQEASSSSVATIDEVRASQRPGTVIGPYKLIEPIGEGGMGTVWMAQQTEPVKRLVALKLIKPGMDSKAVIARFEAERQALALMDHPNIARVLDGGTSAAGRPYFVMDLVKGVPITRYCDEHHLTPRQRLELFVPVCQAIQHAHQKGIIHRDLKPSNVLVALYDGRPVPRVIDFGVAKAAGQPLTDRTLVTGFGAIVGTLEYMSPEQAEVNQLDVDTRSDIYSLGVLLYELLAGSPPFTRLELEKAGLLEMLRVIREQEPSRPSTKLSTAEGLPTLAANRGTEPAKLSRLVRGELDWIVMKALEKDRNRRYETANGFAADVQRYLADEPVQACPPSTWYRTRKFARRNNRALATATVLALAVLAVAATIGWAIRDREANAQEAARERATREAALHAEVKTALNEAEGWQALENWPEALSAVKRAEGLLAGRSEDNLRECVLQFRKDMEMVLRLDDIRMLATDWVGDRFHHEASDRAYAQAFADYGVDIFRLPCEEAAARLGARPGVVVPLLVALDDWAYIRRVIAKVESTGAPLTGVARFERIESAGAPMAAVAQALDQDAWRRQVRAARQLKDPQAHALTALLAAPGLERQPPANLYFLAMAVTNRGFPDRGIELLRQVQRNHPGDFWVNFSLAAALIQQPSPRPDEAVAFLRAALAARPGNIAVLNNLGIALHDDGKPAEAVLCLREALAINPSFAKAYENLGRSLAKLKKADEAIAAYRGAIQLEPNSASAHSGLGLVLFDQGNLDEAIASHRRAVELDPKNASCHELLGRALNKHGKLDDAIAAYQKSVELDPRNALAHNGLGVTLMDQGRLDEAVVSLRQAIRSAPNNSAPLNNLGNALKRQRKYPEAITAYQAAIRLNPNHSLAYSNISDALRKQGKLGEALSACRTAVELAPASPTACYNLSLLLADHSKFEESVAYARKAIELERGSARNYFALGSALVGLARIDEARDAFLQTIKCDPKHAGAYDRIGTILFGQKKLDAAVTAYRTATEIDSQSAVFWNNLGLALDAQGNSEEAITCFRKAIELDPKYAAAHSSLGRMLVKQNKLDEAVAAARKAVELDPKTVRYRRTLGYQLRMQGSLDESIAVYREAIQLDPTSPYAYHGLGLALGRKGLAEEATVAYHEALRRNATEEQRGVISRELNSRASRLATSLDPAARHPRRAVELAKEAIALKPGGQEGIYWNTLGVAHYRAGEWKDAITTLSRGMELRNGGDSHDWIFLAMAHWQLGDKDEARKWYNRAVGWMEKNNPENEELRRFRAEAAELLGVTIEAAPPPKQKK